MKAHALPALALLLLSACGASSSPPLPASEERAAASAVSGAEDGESAPALSGAYRIVELAGQPVVESLVHDPACYAGRALFTFHDDRTLSFSLETACAGHHEYETVCAAELTTAVEWQPDGFRVPVAARARGTVSQYAHAAEPERAGDFDDSCHVGVQPMTWRIRARSDDSIELVNEYGDVMRLEREDEPELDWGALTRQAEAQRSHG